MTVLLAALDEAKNTNGDFILGGWVGPHDDWKNHFIPAWKEHVLAGPPRIPYLHMSEIWGEDWQDKHKITGSDAFWRVEAAATVLRTTGSLYPITAGIRVDQFKSILVQPLKTVGGFGELVEQPDYLCYIAYSILVLQYVSQTFPQATKVNILIERSDTTTRGIQGFHRHLHDVLSAFPHLLKLRGWLKASGKRSIPLQAADTLCWYEQRGLSGRGTRADRRRAWMIGSRLLFSFHFSCATQYRPWKYNATAPESAPPTTAPPANDDGKLPSAVQSTSTSLSHDIGVGPDNTSDHALTAQVSAWCGVYVLSDRPLNSMDPCHACLTSCVCGWRYHV